MSASSSTHHCPAETVEEVITTDELASLPSRAPDYRIENEALLALARHLADSPKSVLQKLVDTALVICRADSAGISLEEDKAGEEIFRWQAIAGEMTSFLGGTMPRHFSPCGIAVDRRRTEVMRDPVRFYPYIAGLNMPIREVLLVPFYNQGRPVGTVWIVSHKTSPAFDAEDARLAGSLAQFASAAYESLTTLAQRERVQRQLLDMGAKLEAALEAGSIATWTWDILNDRVFADAQFARLFSVSAEEAGGGPISVYTANVHPEDLERVHSHIQQVIETGGVCECEYRIVRPDGSHRWVMGRGKPLLDDQGRATHFPGVVVDITERKAAQLSKEKEQRALWAALPVPCYSLDVEGRIDFFNEAAAELWGRRPELNKDKWGGALTTTALDGSPIRCEEGPTAMALRGQRSVRGIELYVVRPDGSRRWIITHPDPIFDSSGSCIGVVNVMFDVTDERLATAEVVKARDQALAASRAKDDFLAALSHELRTPLNPALLLASDAAANPAYPEAVRMDFESISRSIELEARLIDDLLDLTRISRGLLKLDSVSVDLHAVVKEAAQKVQADAAAKKITLNWDLAASSTMVKGDPVRLQQVFWNVLKNAVKFTPSLGVVSISSSVGKAGDHIAVQIRDTGIGMSAADLSSVFGAFVQGSHAENGGAHVFGGLGLGLAISEKVMGLHQGRITATSEGLRKGSTFEIEMPLAAQAERVPAPLGGQPAKLGLPAKGERPQWRFLIVEDNAGTRQALQRLLVRRGHSVAVAGSGQEACVMAAGQSFDLAICDVGLPDTDGHTLVGELHRLQPRLAAIAMTGYGSERDIEHSDKAGFLLHLTKPVSVPKLEEAIASILG